MSPKRYGSGLARAGGIAILMAVGPNVPMTTSVPVHPEGTLKLSSREIVPGSRIEIGGERFAEGGDLELRFVGVAGEVPLGEVTADSAGSFVQSFDVPADLGLGGYRLIAVASDGDEVASLNVEILPAAADVPGHLEMDMPDHEAGEPTAEHMEVDRTGDPLVMGGAVIGIVLALGAGMLLIRRR